jgi:hypothetical protein
MLVQFIPYPPVTGVSEEPLTAYRYIRFNIAQNGGDGTWTQITEVEIAAEPSGADITGTGTAYWSGANVGNGNEPDKAFDNNLGTSWAVISPVNSILGYDLGFLSPIFEVRMTVATPARGPSDWVIEGSVSGAGDWVTLASFTDMVWGVSETKTFALAPLALYLNADDDLLALSGTESGNYLILSGA